MTDFDTKMARLNASAAAGSTGEQHTAAYYLLDDLLATAAQHGLRLDDLDAAGIDLGGRPPRAPSFLRLRTWSALSGIVQRIPRLRR